MRKVVIRASIAALLLAAMCLYCACDATSLPGAPATAASTVAATADVEAKITEAAALPAAETPGVTIEPSTEPLMPKPATPKPESNADGMPLAPDFTLDGRGGEVFTLSQYEGKVVILNFFATWCPPCREEMPELQAFYEGVADSPNVAFFLIDLTDGQRETKAKADKYVDDNGITIPLLYDTRDTAAELYEVYSIPTTVVIDREGYVVEYIEGAVSDAAYGNYVSSKERFTRAVDKALNRE